MMIHKYRTYIEVWQPKTEQASGQNCKEGESVRRTKRKKKSRIEWKEKPSRPLAHLKYKIRTYMPYHRNKSCWCYLLVDKANFIITMQRYEVTCPVGKKDSSCLYNRCWKLAPSQVNSTAISISYGAATHQLGNTSSHMIIEVKQRWARLVLGLFKCVWLLLLTLKLATFD